MGITYRIDKKLGAAVRLTSFDVRGFRSLADVSAIPISEPTILAGHNDGGKSATIDALRFFLGSYLLNDDDRTYVDSDKAAGDLGERCNLTEVEGRLQLDEWEQQAWSLPDSVSLRRRSPMDGENSLELLALVPEDDRLRNVPSLRVPDLKILVSEYGLKPAGHLKAELALAVTEYANTHATTNAWITVIPEIARRLPQMLVFGGTEESPDTAVRTALMGRFNEYISDPALQGKLSQIEDDIEGRLRIDAKGLCDHIQSRCSDLGEVTVAPQVSFRHGFVAAPLRIARTSGQPVSLERSGQGSNRRILLAVWEWTSRLMRQDETVAPANSLTNAQTEQHDDFVVTEPPLTQTVVVYDEPDTHLDYGQQRRIMRLIREQCALSHVDVVVATHSMNLIDGVDIADIVHLKLENGRTVLERLADGTHEIIDGYLGTIAASVGLRNSVLLHERCFLAVEGSSEQRAFPLLFRLAEGIPLQSAGIALWACGGNDGALNLAKYLVEHNRAVVLAIDADSATKKMFKEASLKSVFGTRMNDYVEFIGEGDGQEFEATFPDAVWVRVANKIWPRKEGEWHAEDIRQCRLGGKFSENVHYMLKESSESGPSGKASMMAELAAQLANRADVPATLLTLFSRLRALAS